MKKIFGLLVLVTPTLLMAAQDIAVRFDSLADVEILRGEATLQTDGYSGNCLQLLPETTVKIPVDFQPNSRYAVQAHLKTSSGADNISLTIDGLGKYNTGVSSALATWAPVEFTVNVPADAAVACFTIILDKTADNSPAYVDEITATRIGDFAAEESRGIPARKPREVASEMGIDMLPDEKMAWMLDDKLGMFIHWGLYSGPGKGEWYMENQGISPEDYRRLAYPESGESYFSAKDFDAASWADLAKKAGMRYMNMVTEHHDGYALFESSYPTAFTSMQTHGRDFVKEYVEACRAAGLRVGIYKTLINWRYPGYYDIYGTDCKPNKFGYRTDAAHKENARLMKEELYCQVKELLTNYGKIDQLFWDGGWLAQQGSDADAAFFWESGRYMSPGNEWPVDERYVDRDSTGAALGLMGMARKYQPDMAVNPRCGWRGDYTCEEGTGAVTGGIRSGVVEKCLSLSPGWGYNVLMENPDRIMPLDKLKRFCADCMVRNMCLLVNIGPDRHGNVPRYTAERLLEFGEWVDKVGDAIYGTRGGPWEPVDGQYGFTCRDNFIYVYFLGGYMGDSFDLPPVDPGMKAIAARDLYTGEKVDFANQDGDIVSLRNLDLQPDQIQIIAIEFEP